MLKQLSINNYALIESLTVQFETGFTVITGETGAGKSILLGALGLVLGNRSDTAVLMDKEKKCVVETVFTLPDNSLKPYFDENELDFDLDCILRREINPQGKSRAFVNDVPVGLQTLKYIGSKLVDIHSQYDSLLLSDEGFQLMLLDELAKNGTLLEEYKNLFLKFTQSKRKLTELKEMAQKNAAENDFLQFQYDELEKAELKEGEFEEIQDRLGYLNHAEEVKTILFSAVSVLNQEDDSLLSRFFSLNQSVQKLKNFLPQSASLCERLENLSIELKDVAYELNRLEELSQFDPNEMQQLNERMNLLHSLIYKHHINDFSKLFELKSEFSAKLESFANLDFEIDNVEKEIKEVSKQLLLLAENLHKNRQKAILPFEKEVTETIRLLGMPHGNFKINCNKTDLLNTNGNTSIQFMFSANKGVDVDNIEKVASGGELSRLMLAIKSLVASCKYIPTIIFDEIDTGVSGEVAFKLGKILQRMADKIQVISISHLPQIAGRANHHLFVFKDEKNERSHSEIKKLSYDERIIEIAKMLSNDKITDEAKKAAKNLLED